MDRQLLEAYLVILFLVVITIFAMGGLMCFSLKERMAEKSAGPPLIKQVSETENRKISGDQPVVEEQPKEKKYSAAGKTELDYRDQLLRNNAMGMATDAMTMNVHYGAFTWS